jgi:hypothetical protein
MVQSSAMIGGAIVLYTVGTYTADRLFTENLSILSHCSQKTEEAAQARKQTPKNADHRYPTQTF